MVAEVIVELVTSSLVKLELVPEMLVVDRLVVVAEVNVAFPPAMFAVVMLAVAIFEVVEFVVLAFSVVKLAVVPHKVVIVARVDVRVLINPVAKAAIEPVMFVTVVEASVDEPELEILVEVMVVRLALVADRFVEVELVIVPLVVLIPVNERLDTLRLVIVAEEIVALVLFRLVNVPVVPVI